MKNSSTNQDLTNSLDTLNKAKEKVVENNLNEQQLVNLIYEASKAKLTASKLIESIDKMKNSYELYLEKRFDLNIGEIKNSQDVYFSFLFVNAFSNSKKLKLYIRCILVISSKEYKQETTTQNLMTH